MIGGLSKSYFRNDGGGSQIEGSEECVGSVLFNKNLLFYEPFICMLLSNRMWQLCMNNIQLPGYSVGLLLMKEREKRGRKKERREGGKDKH